MIHSLLQRFADPWSIERELGHLFPALALSAGTPRINAVISGDELHVSAEVPGVNPDDLQISLHEGVLELKGTWPAAPEGDDMKASLRERAQGAFRRRLRLPFEVDQEKITARFGAGILSIVLPKAESEKPRRIPVLAN